MFRNDSILTENEDHRASRSQVIEKDRKQVGDNTKSIWQLFYNLQPQRLQTLPIKTNTIFAKIPVV